MLGDAYMKKGAMKEAYEEYSYAAEGYSKKGESEKANAIYKKMSKVELSKELAEQAAPLLSVLETVNEQLRAADASLEQAARDDVLVQRLCTARSVGVGPVTAVTFVATVDQVERFESAKALRCLVKWAERIAARRGKRIAAVALARKLAGILYAMWRDGTRFGEVTGNAAKAAA